MSAARLGKQLLDEVKEESLDEFLRDLRGIVLPAAQEDVLGVPKLDRLLSILRNPARRPRVPRWVSPGPEDGSDDRGENERYVVDDNDDDEAVDLPTRPLPTKPPIVEITAPPSPTSVVNSPTLRTALCLYLVALAVLPPRQDAVVYISTQGNSHFSAERLKRQIVQLLTSEKGTGNDPFSFTDAEAVAHEALSHVHVFRPSSTAQLLATLKAMPEYLGDMTLHGSRNRRLGLFVIDSVDAFYWQDRMNDDIERIDPTAREGKLAGAEIPGGPLTLALPVSASGKQQQAPYVSRRDMNFSIQSLLKVLQRDYSSTILMTTYPAIPSKMSHWSSFSTLKLEISSLASSIPPFAPHMSLSEALLDREKRKEVVQRGECVAYATHGHDGDWRNDVRERLESLGAEALGWRFKLTENIVVANQDSE